MTLRERRVINRFLRRLLMVCGSLALLAVGWLCVEAIWALRALTSQTVASELLITASIDTVPVIADKRLAAIQADTLKLVDAHAKQIEGTIAVAVRTADARLALMQADAKGAIQKQLGQLNQTVALTAKALPPALGALNHSIAGIASDVHQVAVPIAGTAAQVNDAAPLYLDCEFNPDCAFNRFQGVSKATEQTMQAIAKAAPQMADSAAKIEGHVEKIAGSAEKEADALTRPKKWYQKLTAYLTLAGEVAAHLP